MTGSTSTTGGGGGAAARTLPLLHPSAFRRSSALTKPVNICFIVSFPSIELRTYVSIASLARLNRDAARLGGNVARESSCRFRRVSHAIALFSKGKSHTRSDAKLSYAKSRRSTGSSAEELSKGSKVSRKPVRDGANSSTRNGVGTLMA